MPPVSWPKFLPYPYALQRLGRPVPNQSAFYWPQSQFAPLYLPPGSPSFQPFRYPPPGPLTRVSPLFVASAFSGAPTGPSGDLSALPNTENTYGDHMSYLHRNPEDPLAVATVDALTPVPVPSDLVASDAAVAVAATSELPFEPYAPELLEGLNAVRLKRLQKLESFLSRVSANQRGPVLEKLYQKLLALHDKVADRLEKRLKIRARKQGRLARAKKVIAAFQKARQRAKARRLAWRVHRAVAQTVDTSGGGYVSPSSLIMTAPTSTAQVASEVSSAPVSPLPYDIQQQAQSVDPAHPYLAAQIKREFMSDAGEVARIEQLYATGQITFGQRAAMLAAARRT